MSVLPAAPARSLHQLAAGDEIVEVHLGLIDQHDLEDGVDGGGAIGADGLSQRLEAVELVIEGRQILLPHCCR